MIALVLAAVVAAHPLGNFTVNHYDGLRVTPQRVGNTAIVDYAELPTLQSAARVDADGSGAASPAERAAYAAAACAELSRAQRLTVDGRTLPWQVGAASYAYAPGQGGLRTSRLTCDLSAPAAVSAASSIVFTDSFLGDRIGWREITAVPEGVRFDRPSVPATSVSDRLRSYPADLLTAPLDQRSATLRTISANPGQAAPAPGQAVPAPGSGTPASGQAAPASGSGAPAPASGSAPGDGAGGRPLASLAGPSLPGPIGDWLAGLDRTFTGLIGASSLTVPLGLLAVLLAVALGAGHALIPGHGKTVMAAYLAGRRGRPRDALVVGATVTATHTAGVLVVGLLISALSAVAGESVLSWLGIASGLLIAAVGLRLLWSAARAHRGSPENDHGHGHGHAHGHGHGSGHAPGDEDAGEHGVADRGAHGHPHGHPHGHGHGHGHGHARGGGGRAGLIGLGVAGGLVPSPSALIVLLGAAALGRTWFGVALVAAYGLGMAVTLTATGLLLVRLASRLDALAAKREGLAGRLAGLTPIGTAATVVLLGAGLAVRGLTGAV
ncbi:High-affinity nickel-transporter [Sphaerisporangium sp. NPDC005288]|uniref:High-affinity nickel-transporter n=1 Tax=Sphaerisporangium sp. NPDC005288 TaxID=3155114 RepID=UPI0033BBF5EE